MKLISFDICCQVLLVKEKTYSMGREKTMTYNAGAPIWHQQQQPRTLTFCCDLTSHMPWYASVSANTFR